MAELDFERRLERLFGEASELPDAAQFAERVERRLDAGWTIAAVAAAVGVESKAVRKWRDRFRAEGGAGLVTARRDRTVRLLGSTALPRPRSQRYAAHACPGR